jgi:hypothetical protein
MKTAATLTVATLIGSAWLYAMLFHARLPEALPYHWDVSGRATYGGRPFGLIALPATMTFIWLISPLLRRYDRRWKETQPVPVPGVFETKLALTIAVIFAIWLYVVASAISWAHPLMVLLGTALSTTGGFIAYQAVHRASARSSNSVAIGSVLLVAGIGIIVAGGSF